MHNDMHDLIESHVVTVIADSTALFSSVCHFII